MMSLQGQAYANVRDVLAPLFCNGRSFSSLIDELCKHFKLDTPASGHDAAGGLEAGSESQSTCSEAEVHVDDRVSDTAARVIFRSCSPSRVLVSTLFSVGLKGLGLRL